MTTFTLAKVGGAGRSARSIRIGEHHWGHNTWPLYHR